MDLSPIPLAITSTIPVEIPMAAGVPVRDLNNVFIGDAHPQALVDAAEAAGLPHNTCTWVKGIHGVFQTRAVQRVIGVVEGDCSPMRTLLEGFLPPGAELIPFAYPYDKNRAQLRAEMQKMMEVFKVEWDEVMRTKQELDRVRALALEIDRRTWQDSKISGEKNFWALVNCSDFNGDAKRFEADLRNILETSDREPIPSVPRPLRLGLLGVPGVFSDLHPFLESHGAHVVYHEIARQFAMPSGSEDLLEQYLAYTYPYSIQGRILDIQQQIRIRRLDGCIHYAQSFCHHQMEDLLFRQHLPIPLLTLEGERPGSLDGRTRTRIEAFLEMLSPKR